MSSKLQSNLAPIPSRQEEQFSYTKYYSGKAYTVVYFPQYEDISGMGERKIWNRQGSDQNTGNS